MRLQLMGMVVVIGHHAGRIHRETARTMRRNGTPDGGSLPNSLIMMDFQLNYVRFDLEHTRRGHSKPCMGISCKIIDEVLWFRVPLFEAHRQCVQLRSGPTSLLAAAAWEQVPAAWVAVERPLEASTL